MNQLRVFAGLRSSDGGIAEAESGFTDDGKYYGFAARSQRVFPAGIGGEAIFDVAYVLITSSVHYRLYLSAFVDGVEYAISLLQPPATPTKITTSRFEVPLRRPLKNKLGASFGKAALRGGWIEVSLASASDEVYPPGLIRIDEVRVEGEVVVESLTPLAPAGT